MIKIKRFFLVAVLLFSLSARVLGVEGMWLPVLIQQNIEEMQRMGLELNALDLYNEQGPSLKDGIVRFGRGCTGSFISPEGLLLTNHHCGYGQIQAHSSVENDYLRYGFWAASREEELANPGLTISILVRMENVTEKVLAAVSGAMNEQQRSLAIREVSRKIAAEAREGGKYETQVSPFYYGNEYYLFVSEVFRDVRLVGAPPSSVGKYGGDVDNWMWPRHSGDFALFRVYAGADNKPADYHPDNQPYRPAHHFPVSGRTVQEQDFTMVYGFPGRTTRYLTSQAVSFIMEKENPMGIALRTRILQLYEQDMASSDHVRIQYASKHARVANAWKKWIGENRGLERLQAVEQKKQQEQAFMAWVAQNPHQAADYGGLMDAFATTYRAYEPIRHASRLYAEAPRNIEIVRFASGFEELARLASEKNPDLEAINRQIERLKGQAQAFFKDYNAPTDQKVFEAMVLSYYQLAQPGFVPEVLVQQMMRFKQDASVFAKHVFTRSFLVSGTQTMDFLQNFKVRDVKRLQKDPAFIFASQLSAFYQARILHQEQQLNTRLDSLYRVYTAGLRQMHPDQNFFPDANGTLRITYGRVEGSYPRDAVKFLPYSTARGILEKAAQTEIEDYRISDELKTLLQRREYGAYAQDDELVVNFIASNHTTGGNSGSPVIDARGAVIGLNFDRSWESTMSDVMFDPQQCRNISVNAAYILWVVEHYAGMKYLVDEMTVVW